MKSQTVQQVPADVMSNVNATAEEKSPYAPSVLAKCVCTTGTECNGMIANAGVAAVVNPPSLFVSPWAPSWSALVQ